MIDQHPSSFPKRYPIPSDILAAFEAETTEESASLREVWDLTEGYYGQEPEALWYRNTGVAIWQDLQVAMQRETPEKRSPLRLIISPWKAARPMRYAAMAACLALLLAVGVVLSDSSTGIEAPYGEQLVHELPDGSTLRLNSGASISYDDFGDGNRDIKLTDGEVFFDVTESDTPFRVHTFNGIVTVLGTTFNVRAWSHDMEASTDVSVQTGTVKLASRKNPDNVIVIKAGHAAKLANDANTPVAVEVTEPDQAISWLSGGFKYSNHTIGTIANELERRYDIQIKVTPKEFENVRKGILKENPANAEEIIRDICELSCVYHSVPGGYVIAQHE